MIDSGENGRGDEALIDLLVDGELGEEERRELLRRLDEVPGGWRRCAFSFLEAQVWRESARVRDNAVAAVSECATLRGPRTVGRPRRLPAILHILALAATFVFAFSL